MEDNDSLGSILGGASAFHGEVKAEPVQAAPESVAEPAAEPVKATQPRDESGKFAKPEAKADPEPAPVEAKADGKQDKPAKTPDTALAEMSRRLKAAEARVREYESQKQQQQPPPSVFEDEDGAIRSRVVAETSPLRAVLLDQSVELAKLRHADSWEEAESAFYEAVEANPALVEQFRNAVNPGEFAYQHGMNHKVMSEYGGNVVAMRDAVRKEGEAKLTEAQTRIKALEAEVKSLKDAKAEADALPKSLNNRSSAPVGSETPTDPEDISQIVRFGKTG